VCNWLGWDARVVHGKKLCGSMNTIDLIGGKIEKKAKEDDPFVGQPMQNKDDTIPF